MSTTEPDTAAPTLYSERGSSWWPVLWGPVFAACGLLVEALTGGPVGVFLWSMVAGGFSVAAAVWVHGRRRLCSVRVTRSTVTLGRETVSLRRLVAVTEVGAPVGARVLGGGWTVPKGAGEVPLLLKEGRVLAWARDPEALTRTLASLVE